MEATIPKTRPGAAAANIVSAEERRAEVERRLDTQPFVVHAIPSKPRNELLTDLLLEVLSECLFTTQGVSERQRKGASRFVGAPVEQPRLAHHAQHEIAARDRAFRVHCRRIGRWRLHQAGNQR